MIRSLGYRTDLFILEFEGVLVDKGEYIVARTPSNPRFYWGNLLVFKRPPEAGDHDAWVAAFARELGAVPGIEHVTLGWDSPEGELGAVHGFLDRGFQIEKSVVLTARAVVTPPKLAEEVVVRPLGSDADWEQALDNQIACGVDGYPVAAFRAFKLAQMERYRRMQEAGLGLWFGAFRGDRLTADLGVFVKDGVGRFQSVGTHPDFRRQGICGRLVYDAARIALGEMGARELVMVADEEYHAAKIYESVGFRPAERTAGVCRAPSAG